MYEQDRESDLHVISALTPQNERNNIYNNENEQTNE
jgi:hypothetical protein